MANFNRLLVEHMQIAAGFVPVNLATAANPADWVSMKGFDRCTIVFFAAAGTAGDDPILTVQQATAVAGTGAKALNFTRVDAKQGADLQAIGTFTAITQAAANTYTHADSAENQKIWVVEVKADDLDVDNGFDCVGCSVSKVGTNAQLGGLLYILTNPRYAPPGSAIVD